MIVMELVKGMPLDDWLDQRHSGGNGGVTVVETQRIMKQLVAGMSAVHSENIAHRDIKPGNLILDLVNFKLVIVDFGLSKHYDTSCTITCAGEQLGTPLYMSPEQVDGKVTSCSSDIWSIGIVWHEIRTSFTPFEPTASKLGVSMAERRESISQKDVREMRSFICDDQHDKPRKLPMLDMTPAVQRIIAKCLNTVSEERYQDAQELVNEFEKLERENADASQSPSRGVPQRKPFMECNVEEVFKLVQDIGDGFKEAADVMKSNGFDGPYFLDMLERNDEDLTISIAEGGLGFTRMQMNRVKAKMLEALG